MATKFLSIKVFSVEEQLKKHPEIMETDLQSLREWASKQPHLPKLEDVHLILFLHSNYCRMEPTKTTIENFFTARTHLPEYFDNRDPLALELRKACQVVAYIPLKMKTKEGYQILFQKLLDPEPSHFDFDANAKLFFMISELTLLSTGPVNGIAFIADVSGVSLGHISRLSLTAIKKLLFYIQEAAPVRLKSIHFVNSVSIMQTIVNMVKPFMKTELINMIHFHSSLESMKQYIPIETLPNYVGGKAGDIEELFNAEIRRLEENRDWFLREQVEMKVNESLRIGSPKSGSDLFGMAGNFKKLEID